MRIVGFATADEIIDLQKLGFNVEDAPAGCVSDDDDEVGVEVSVRLDASVHQALLILEENSHINVAEGSLNIVAFTRRKNELMAYGAALLSDAGDFKYCNHKNPDGSDARYPIGNGELACICGNEWD